MWLSNLRLILPDRVVERGSLLIVDGVIKEIVEGGPEMMVIPDALNLNGMTVMAGIIDLHGDMLERDIEPRPDARFPVPLALHELDKKLAATGITTAYSAVSFAWTQGNLRSQEYAIDIINTITAMRHDLLVDLLIHARFEVTNPDTIPILKPMLEQGLIQLVSVMDHTPGQGQYKNVKKYVEFMTRWLGFDPHDVGEKTISQVEYSIETNAAQPRNWDIVRDITETALAYNIPVASHDDDTVEKVQKLASLGVTISEFPVTLVAAEEARRHGMHVIMGSPNAYRGASTSGNLGARDAIKANVADILATDYFPAAMFHSMLLLHKQEGLPLYESANLITQNPAAAMRLNDRGRIAPGLRADLVVFDDTDYPRIHATLRQGTPIYWDMRMAKLVREQNFRFPANYAGDSIEVEPVAEESVS